MQAFKDYVIQEFKEDAEGYVGTEFKFSHNFNIKTDKKTETTLRTDIIKCAIKFYDKDMNLLLSKNIQFENNDLPKSIAGKLINISPDELVNRFNNAKGEIHKVIVDEHNVKREEINNKLKELAVYAERFGDVIPSQFKGEQITVIEDKEPKKKNKKYDM